MKDYVVSLEVTPTDGVSILRADKMGTIHHVPVRAGDELEAVDIAKLHLKNYQASGHRITLFNVTEGRLASGKAIEWKDVMLDLRAIKEAIP